MGRRKTMEITTKIIAKERRECISSLKAAFDEYLWDWQSNVSTPNFLLIDNILEFYYEDGEEVLFKERVYCLGVIHSKREAISLMKRHFQNEMKRQRNCGQHHNLSLHRMFEDLYETDLYETY